MAIIYPPFIGETIPGFAGNSTNGYTIKVPFTMNPAVSETEVKGFALQIKDYITSNIVATLYTAADLETDSWYKSETKSGIITFSTLGTGFTPEDLQYYKFQLGYLSEYDDNEEPPSNEKIYYSTVSIGKCIGVAPTIKIYKELSCTNELNTSSGTDNQGVYYGKITNLNASEKIYLYKFILKKGNEIIENYETIQNNTNNKTIQKYKLKTEILYEENTSPYKLQFIITTINGYVGESQEYIINKENCAGNIDANISVSVSNSTGEINIEVQHLDDIRTHNYSLERTINKINFEPLIIFNLTGYETIIQKDYSIEQDIKYYYSIRRIKSDGRYISPRLYYEESVSVDYEDIFLIGLDGKVLKIKFDPKVSSFKNTILESKTDTIGSKYPFFFRNGNVNYKEIPISGLISYHMDENQNFMTNTELGFPYNTTHEAAGQSTTIPITESVGRSINLDGPNIAAERKFRLTVLDWLTNGEPKLFRSPTEGVYVIRLMNVSFSPNDTLGRMLYSFSATGYEVSDHDLETLINKGYIHFNITGQASSRLGYFVLGTSTLGEVV